MSSTDRYLTRFPFREKGRCSWCGGPVKPPRRSWCSAACVEEWAIRSSGSHVRHRVEQRDHGVCAKCGFDAAAARRELEAALEADDKANGNYQYRRRGRYHFGHITPASWLAHDRWLYRFPNFHAVADRLGIPMRRRNIQVCALWEADHIVPVVEGGGCVGLDGYRTLCWKCHARETAALARKRAQRRAGLTPEVVQALIDAFPA